MNEKSTNEYFRSFKPMLYIMLVKKFSLCVDTSPTSISIPQHLLLILVRMKNIQQSIQNECSSMCMGLSYNLLILIANSKTNHRRQMNVLILVMAWFNNASEKDDAHSLLQRSTRRMSAIEKARE
jgi:hypothetical protein